MIPPDTPGILLAIPIAIPFMIRSKASDQERCVGSILFF